jgi:hypothetical protein
VLKGPLNGSGLKAYVERPLTPTLNSGDCVILGNLSSPKVEGIREPIKAYGAQLMYLPPYSPDFNPIELAVAKLKALLRHAEKWPMVVRSGLASTNCSTSFRLPNADIMSAIAAMAPHTVCFDRSKELMSKRIAGTDGLIPVVHASVLSARSFS